jgi:hypothetical protein
MFLTAQKRLRVEECINEVCQAEVVNVERLQVTIQRNLQVVTFLKMRRIEKCARIAIT